MFRTRAPLTSAFSGLVFAALAVGAAGPAGADDDFGVGLTSLAYVIEVSDVTAKVGEPAVLRATLKIRDGYKILKHYNNRVVSLSSLDNGVAFESKVVPATLEEELLGLRGPPSCDQTRQAPDQWSHARRLLSRNRRDRNVDAVATSDRQCHGDRVVPAFRQGAESRACPTPVVFWPKLDRGPYPKRDENYEHDPVDDREWRLRLGRRQFVKGRDLHKSLYDKHEHVEIKRRNCAGDEDPSPWPREVEAVIGRDRADEQNERQPPAARGGSKPNGGNGKPVRLVKIVAARKKATAALKFRPSKRP